MSRGGNFKHFIYFRWMITTYPTPEYFLCIEILSISHLPPWKHLDFFCWVEDNNNEFIQIPKKGNFLPYTVSSYWISSKFLFLRPDLLSKDFFRDSVINKYCLKGLGSEKSWMLKNDFTYLTFKAKDIEYQVCHKLIRSTYWQVSQLQISAHAFYRRQFIIFG